MLEFCDITHLNLPEIANSTVRRWSEAMNFHDLKIVTVISLACRPPKKTTLQKLVYTSLPSLILRSQRLQTRGKHGRVTMTGLPFF